MLLVSDCEFRQLFRILQWAFALPSRMISYSMRKSLVNWAEIVLLKCGYVSKILDGFSSFAVIVLK